MNRWVESITARLVRLDTLIIFITGFVVLQTEVPVLVEPVLSVLRSGSILPAGRVAQLPMFLFIYVVLYSLLRSVYPTWLTRPIHESALVRFAVAGLGFVASQHVYLGPNRFAVETPGPIVSMEGMSSFAVYSVIGVVILTLSYYHTEGLSVSSDGPLAEPVLRLSSSDDAASEWDDDFEQLRQTDGRLFVMLKLLTVIAVSLIGFLPVLILGNFVGILARYYPVLELVAVLRVAIHQLPLARIRESSVSLPQVEEVFYEHLKHASTFSGVGMLVPVMTGLGLLVTIYEMPDIVEFVSWRDVGWALEELAESPSVTTLGYTLAIGSSVAAQNAAAATPVLIGVYGLWFLMRIVQRFPGLGHAYVSDWEPHSPSTDVPTRPRGFLLPVLPLALLYRHHNEHFGQYLGIALDGATFLVLWVAVVMVAAWTVIKSRSTDPVKCVRSVQLEVFAPYLSLSTGVYLLSPSSEYLFVTVAVYLLSNFLVYSPSIDNESANRWWVRASAIIFPFAALLGGVPLRWVVGLTGVIVGSLLIDLLY